MLDQWYGIMPNKILFDKDLSDKEKLLFCFISSLCAEKWYCRASNGYLGEKINLSWSRVSWWISWLQRKWYIVVESENSWQNRRIALAENSKTPLPKTANPLAENVKGTLAENGKHNNTIYNSIKEQDNIKEQQSWISEKIDELISDIKEVCAELWVLYDKEDERNFAKHILTAKEFGRTCSVFNTSRKEFTTDIIRASVRINYRKWPCSWPKKIYKNYAEVYNLTKQKTEKQSNFILDPTKL